MEPRPIIKILLSPLDNKLELTGKMGLVIMWGLAIYVFFNSPSTIPIHFNFAGQPDNYGNKLTLLLLPVLGTIIYFGLSQLNRYPHIFNYPAKITEANAQKQYSIATRMLRYLKVAIVFIFALILLFIHLTTNGVSKGLSGWFLPLILALFLVPTIIMIKQSFKKENMMA